MYLQAFGACLSTSWVTLPTDNLIKLISQWAWKAPDSIRPIPRRPDKILFTPEDHQFWVKGLAVDAMVVVTATKKELAEEISTVHPPNQESKVMDRFRK